MARADRESYMQDGSSKMNGRPPHAIGARVPNRRAVAALKASKYAEDEIDGKRHRKSPTHQGDALPQGEVAHSKRTAPDDRIGHGVSCLFAMDSTFSRRERSLHPPVVRVVRPSIYCTARTGDPRPTPASSGSKHREPSISIGPSKVWGSRHQEPSGTGPAYRFRSWPPSTLEAAN